MIVVGDVMEAAGDLDPGSIDAVVTSPPYAEQRSGFYGGVTEAQYPEWTVAWLAALRPALRPQGSVAIVIRPHVADGQMSDYMLRTRLAVRQSGWFETDELIWIKPDSPPLGHRQRPRRAWESILWFSPTRQPWCDPYANGGPSKRIGMVSRRPASLVHGVSRPSEGRSRSADYVEVGVSHLRWDDASDHPARYPVPLAEWLVRLLCPPGGRILDPFAGSGTSGVAALRLGREFIGIERDPAYAGDANARLAAQQADLQTELFAFNR